MTTRRIWPILTEREADATIRPHEKGSFRDGAQCERESGLLCESRRKDDRGIQPRRWAHASKLSQINGCCCRRCGRRRRGCLRGGRLAQAATYEAGQTEGDGEQIFCRRVPRQLLRHLQAEPARRRRQDRQNVEAAVQFVPRRPRRPYLPARPEPCLQRVRAQPHPVSHAPCRRARLRRVGAHYLGRGHQGNHR